MGHAHFTTTDILFEQPKDRHPTFVPMGLAERYAAQQDTDLERMWWRRASPGARGVVRLRRDGLKCARSFKQPENHHRRHQVLHLRKHPEIGPLLENASPRMMTLQ